MNMYDVYGGMQLPTQLTDEETRYYFEQLKTGNKVAFNVLVEHNLRLVIYIASQYEGENINPEDTVSAGNIGLIKAVNAYDISKGCKFATFASRCIHNEILMMLREVKKASNADLVLDHPFYTDEDGKVVNLIDIIPSSKKSVHYNYEKRETYNELYEAFMSLTDKEKIVIAETYGLNRKASTQKEIAAMFNLSQSQISRIIKKAELKMKKHIISKYNLDDRILNKLSNDKIKTYKQ